MYQITKHTKKAAERLGVQVKPSIREGKKIDVYKDGSRIASIGSIGMSDYGTYLVTHGKEYANARRRLYYIRHPSNIGNEKWAKKLLW